ncbi:MAG TPA: thermonuclease family protein [Actinomycetota bacterium]|nr:thermonuclease family protein [Actinomycetota bacterium]
MRTGEWPARIAVVFLLLPFWLTSEIRQASWPRAGKVAAIASLWLLTVTTAVASTATQPVPPPEPTEEGEPATPVASDSALAARQFDAAPSGWPTPSARAIEAYVVSVTDGDTIVLSGIDVGNIHASGGRSSRLIGVDTPEIFGASECYGTESSAFTKRELSRSRVLVEFDVDRLDQYDRALVYVWHPDGRLFNARLASEGYAQQLTVPPNVRYADLFGRLVREAREASRGLWGSGCASQQSAQAAPSLGASSGPTVDRDCPDFSSQADAQRFYEEQGGPARDPHRLDADNDGIACESSSGAAPAPQNNAPEPTEQSSGANNCHPSYPDFCIPPPPPDLDCKDVSGTNFTVRHDVSNADPHRFDADRDGVGCES